MKYIKLILRGLEWAFVYLLFLNVVILFWINLFTILSVGPFDYRAKDGVIQRRLVFRAPGIDYYYDFNWQIVRKEFSPCANYPLSPWFDYECDRPEIN